jgi:hypothetical protein
MSTPLFKLDTAITAENHTLGASQNSTFSWQLPEEPSVCDVSQASGSPYGTYPSDLASGKFLLHWQSWEEVKVWISKEQEMKSIEIRLKEVLRNGKGRWLEQHVYVCARRGTGGKKEYSKKQEWNYKLPTKRIEHGCPCRLVIKSYPDTSELLGKYRNEHSHEIGDENLKFTQISNATRLRIAEWLRIGLTPDRIVSCTLLTISNRLKWL